MKVAAIGVAVIVPVMGACEGGGAGEGQVGAVQLGEPEAVYTEPFSVVSTVREFRRRTRAGRRCSRPGGGAARPGRRHGRHHRRRRRGAGRVPPARRGMAAARRQGRCSSTSATAASPSWAPSWSSAKPVPTPWATRARGVCSWCCRRRWTTAAGSTSPTSARWAAARIPCKSCAWTWRPGRWTRWAWSRCRASHGARPEARTTRESKPPPSPFRRLTPGAFPAMDGWPWRGRGTITWTGSEKTAR